MLQDRTWRKTRSPSDSLCYGADPNRNWDFHWKGKNNVNMNTQILDSRCRIDREIFNTELVPVSLNHIIQYLYGCEFYVVFDVLFVSGTEAGASSSPCSDSYAGESPFSEIETRSLAKYLAGISESLVGYLDFHSYSQLLMFPYGHTHEQVSNYDELVSCILLPSPSFTVNVYI